MGRCRVSSAGAFYLGQVSRGCPVVSYKRVKRQEFRRLMKATMLGISGLGSKIGGGGVQRNVLPTAMTTLGL